MGRKFGWHSGKLSCKELDVDSTLSFGSLNFGSVELDTLLLNGRLATGVSAGGTSLALGATYAYGEAIELRYNVTNWTGIGSSFKALYLRSEADLGGSYGLRCAEFYAVMDTSTTTGLSSLQNLYAEMLVKASASNRTLTNGHCVEANISIENQTGTLTLTNSIYCLYAKAQTGTGINDYTKVNGIKIAGRDDGTARVFGNALDIVDAEATVCTWTNGIYIKNTAIKTSGLGKAINIQGGSATIKGIFVGADADTAGSGIKIAGASWDTAQGNGFYCDDGGTALVGYTECMTVRMLTTAAVASGDVSTAALHPDLTLNANYTGTGGLSSIWGNTTIKSGVTVNLNGSIGDVGGATFGIDIAGTLAANSHACGVSVGVGGSGTKTGILSGFRIRGATGTVDWDAFLSIEDGDGSWTSMTTAAASQTATMTNAPAAGNPSYWLNIYIGETKYVIPAFASA